MPNTAWFWGDNQAKGIEDEAKSPGYNSSRIGTAASRTYTPYSPFKVQQGEDSILVYPRATPPKSGMTARADSRPWSTASDYSGIIINISTIQKISLLLSISS